MTIGFRRIETTTSGSVNYVTEYITLTATDITNKYVTLTNLPTDLGQVSIVGGSCQISGVDFSLVGQNISWNGLVLESDLAENDILSVSYIY